MERRFSQSWGWLVAPSPVHSHGYCPRLLSVVRDPRYESSFGHLFHSRRQSMVKRPILINVVDDTRTVVPVPVLCIPDCQMGITFSRRHREG